MARGQKLQDGVVPTKPELRDSATESLTLDLLEWLVKRERS